MSACTFSWPIVLANIESSDKRAELGAPLVNGSVQRRLPGVEPWTKIDSAAPVSKSLLK